MTYKEFKRQVFSIYSETYNGADVSPIEYGIQRANFEEKKLGQLIALAGRTDFSTAKRKVEGWRRQLERVGEIKTRLEQRRTETRLSAMESNRVKIPRADNSRASQKFSF